MKGLRRITAILMSVLLTLAMVMSIVQTTVVSVSAATYGDGTFQGTGRGRNGDITLDVTISQDKIEKIEVVSQNETPRYWEKAALLLDTIVSNNSTEVDAISGATKSCDGIKTAVNEALTKAAASENPGTTDNPDNPVNPDPGKTDDPVEPEEPVDDTKAFNSGEGTESAPYVIKSAKQLENFATTVDEGEMYTGKFIVLGSDIDLSSVENWNPIGAEGKASSNKTKLFDGSFDGRGHNITGLKISGEYESEANVGLFSTLGGNARVSNVTVTEADIDVKATGSFANIRAGVIAGDTFRSSAARAAVVDGCNTSGKVFVAAADGQSFAGGILGRAFTKSVIINCTADVTGLAESTGSWNTAYAGGITGMAGNSTVIVNCASFDSVMAVNESGGADAYAGGITGMVSNAMFNCYVLGDSSITTMDGVTPTNVGAIAGSAQTNAYGTGNYYSDKVAISVNDANINTVAWPNADTLANLKSETVNDSEVGTQSFVDSLNNNNKIVSENLDLAGLTLQSWTVDGGKVVPSGKAWVPEPEKVNPFASGDGSKENPYVIETAEQLRAFAVSVDSENDYTGKYIKLANDIDITGEDWSPIGGSTARFNGVFDGAGNAISGLTIGSEDAPKELTAETAYVGLFGWVNEKAVIKNLTLSKVSIHTHSTGSVYIGGIAGRESGSETEGDYSGARVDGCTVSGTIEHTTDKGTSFVGGVFGHMFKGSVINTSTNMTIDAAEKSGELIEVGGIVGIVNRGLIANCYADGNYTGRAYRDALRDIEGMACVANIAGVNGGYIANCYAAGNVTAPEYSIDAGVIAGWVTGIGKVYNSWYNEGAELTIDGRKVSPVDPFGETVGSGVSDEWGFSFVGSITDKINPYKATEAGATELAEGLNKSFDAFPVDVKKVFGLSEDSFRTWEAKGDKAVFTDETKAITYVQPEIEKKEEKEEAEYKDGTYFGRDKEKTTIVKITVKNSEITETEVVSGDSNPESDGYTAALSRAKFKAKYGDTSNYDAVDTSKFKGAGTAEDPYLVESEAQLRYIAEAINEDVDWYGVYFKQTNDIKVSKEDWNPIGWGIFADADNDGFGQDVVALYPFKGSYDGDNHVIDGLTAGSKDNPVDSNWMGLFGVIQGDYTSNEIPENTYVTTVKNLKLANVDFNVQTKWRNYAAGLVGNAQGGFVIDNCSVTGSVTTNSPEDFSSAAGLAGSLMYGRISNSWTNVEVSSYSGNNYSYAGGMAAVTNRATIINSYALGDVHADASQTNRAEAGGFVALDGGMCINCYAKGNVEAVSKYSMYIGGFVGMAASSSEERQCYYNSDADQKVAGKAVSEKRYAGKFVNESAESSSQAQTAEFMGSEEFTKLLNDNRNNISETLTQIQKAVEADENGSSKYHSIYFNGSADDLNTWYASNSVVGFEEAGAVEDTRAYESGDGTEENPYVIMTAKQLENFATTVDEGESYQGKFVVLGADIDLSDISNWNPIGAEGKSSSNKNKLFDGNFDGKGHTISGLKISGEYDSEANVGLFSTLGGNARVSNVNVTDADIDVKTNGSFANIRAGVIAGDTFRSSSARAAVVNGCKTSGKVKASAADGQSFAGGIFGRAFTKSVITNCTSDVNSEAESVGNWNTAYAGGIAGMTGNSTAVINCAAFGNASATNTSGGADAYAGGITGMLSSTMLNCYATGNFSITTMDGATPNNVGALAGQASTSATGSGNYYADNASTTANGVAVENGAWPKSDTLANINASAKGVDEMSTKAFAKTLNENIRAFGDAAELADLEIQSWTAEAGKVVPSGKKWDGSEADDDADKAENIRIFGDTRIDTALKVADELKARKGVEKFENIVVATGQNFPDALSGGYLAKAKNAPIILVDKTSEAKVADYIAENLDSKGTVYILGGEGAVSSGFEKTVKAGGSAVKRISGSTRYVTNIAILEEAGVNGEDILICSGEGFADSLAASATGLPILLVKGDSLTREQNAFLESKNPGKVYVIGGANAVKPALENKLVSKYGRDNVERLSGATRYDTSYQVAEKFFAGKGKTVIFTYGQNYPDGLAGGVLAMEIGAPLILADSKAEADCVEYAKKFTEAEKTVKSITLGGEGLVSDETVNKMLNK